MLALTVVPGRAGSARVEEVEEPPLADGPVLVQTLAVGVCGTDREIVDGHHGEPPPGRERLVLGHESLGRVVDAPAASAFAPGDLVAGIVRRPDPVPCVSCAAGEWDMCRNGLYTERGIKGLWGFASERYRSHPEFLVRVEPALGELGVLLEPASILAKAWEHVERIGSRATWRPRTVLVTGAGPIGLLAALFGAQRGLDVHVLDRVVSGRKPELVRALGATYHSSSVAEACQESDIVVECTGAAGVVLDVISCTGAGGVVCLTGVSPGGRVVEVDAGMLNRRMVLENDVVFGSVNANRRHYEQAARTLASADRSWLAGLVTRRVPLERWDQALRKEPDDVKVVLTVAN